MPHATTLKELRAMTTEELNKQYDDTAKNTVIGLDFLRQEISHREVATETEAIARMTKQMRDLTVIITVLTIVNIALTTITLLKG